MTLKRLLRILVRIQFILAMGLAALTVSLFLNQRRLSQSQARHFRSFELADELRQSSDDLTRLARTYVATGDEKYEHQYWAVLSIRNGKSPRPVEYSRVYWDLVSATGEKPCADGPAISLRQLMVEAGFTATELKKLAESQDNSDDLVKAETTAMNAVKGLFDDGAGHFTIKKQPDRELAIRLMNDEGYHRSKAKIMKPIDEFFGMLTERTAGDVVKFEQRSMYLLLALGILIIMIVGMFVFSYVTLRRQIGEREKASELLEEQNRSKTGQAALNETMRGDHTVEGLAENVISFLCGYLQASVGAVYICKEDKTLKLAASYAMALGDVPHREVHSGEGVIGQAVLQKKPILVTDCPPDYLTIRTGFGTAVPRNIIVYPLLFNDEVEAIVEIGVVRSFSESDLAFLAATADNIAIALHTVLGRGALEELLEKTQQQAEELQTQQEELRASNEELEEQARALRMAEEQLQSEREELRATNEELQEQTASLERQQQEILNKAGMAHESSAT